MAKTKVHGEYLDPSVISGQTQVTAVGADSVLIFDATDNALKKALVSDLGESNRLPLAGGTMSGNIVIADDSANTEKSILIRNTTATLMIGVEGSSANRFIGSGANNMFLGTTGADGIEFATNNNVRAVLDSSGNVGIGTTSPSTKLEVNGGIRLSGLNGGDGLKFDMAGSTDYVIKESSTNDIFSFGGQIHHNISSGNVGIGTTSPSDLLHITNGDNAVDTRIRLQSFGQLPIWHTYYAAGTESSPTAPTSGTELSRFAVSTYDGNDYSQSAGQIRVVAEANHSSNSAPSYMAFDTNSTTRLATEKMRITSGGNVGINSSASNAKLEVVATSGEVFRADANNGAYRIVANQSNVLLNGTVLVGTSSAVSNAKLTVDGGDMMVQGANNSAGISDLLPGYTRGDYGVFYSSANHIYFAVGSSYISYISGGSGQYTISDARLKENVVTLTGALDKVKQLRGVSHTWKNTDMGTDTSIGMIAQEVEAVYPELVGDGGLPNDNEGNEPMKSVNYANLTPVLIEAIKELEARVKELEK